MREKSINCSLSQISFCVSNIDFLYSPLGSFPQWSFIIINIEALINLQVASIFSHIYISYLYLSHIYIYFSHLYIYSCTIMWLFLIVNISGSKIVGTNYLCIWNVDSTVQLPSKTNIHYSPTDSAKVPTFSYPHHKGYHQFF